MRCPDLMTAWLLAVLGKKLLSVNAIFHVFASRRDLFLKKSAFNSMVLRPGSSMVVVVTAHRYCFLSIQLSVAT